MSLTREASNISSAEHDGATVNAAANAANAAAAANACVHCLPDERRRQFDLGLRARVVRRRARAGRQFERVRMWEERVFPIPIRCVTVFLIYLSQQGFHVRYEIEKRQGGSIM